MANNDGERRVCRGALEVDEVTPVVGDDGVDLEREIWRKGRLRLMPILFAVFFFSHLNRVNLSYAAAPMSETMGFSPAVYGLGAALFFITYALLQAPANLFAQWIGIPRAMAILMCTWGSASFLMGAVGSESQFYTLRLVLGGAEAGITPVVLLFLIFWFTARYRSAAFSLFAVAMPVSGAVGGWISGVIMVNLDGWLGLEGWRWLFFSEALPTLLLSVVVLLYLPPSPSSAKWLTPSHVALLSSEAGRGTSTPHSAERSRGFRSSIIAMKGQLGLTALLALVWGVFTGAYVTLFYWMPKALYDVYNVSPLTAGVVVGIGYAVLGAGLLLGGHVSSKSGGHRITAFRLLVWPIVLFAFALAATGFTSTWAITIALFFVSMGLIGFGQSTFWSVGLSVFPQAAAPLAIGLINSAGAAGAFSLLYGYGGLVELAESSLTPLIVVGGLVLILTVSGGIAGRQAFGRS